MTTIEAYDVFKRYRQTQVELARGIARELDARGLEGVTTNDVRQEMRARGLFPETLDKRWLGMVFPGPGKEFRKTGRSRTICLPDTKHTDGGEWPYWTRR